MQKLDRNDRRRAPSRWISAAWAAVLGVAVSGCSIPSLSPITIPRQIGETWYSKFFRDHPLVGKIWSNADDHFVAPGFLIDAALEADYVLLGEKHDNIDHHQIQAWIINALLESGGRPAVVFEMLADDQQQDLSRFLISQPRDASGLGVAVGWSHTMWPTWAMYQPIADVAVKYRMPILPGSFPRATVSRMMRRGVSVIGQKATRELRLHLPFDRASRKTMRETINVSHLGELPEKIVDKVVDMQIAKDAKMAGALIGGKALGKTDSAVLIAGGGHIRNDIGVPRHLLRNEPAAKVISIILMEVKDGLLGPKEYTRGIPQASDLPFDFVWFTPRTEEDDEEKQRERIKRAAREHSQ